MCGLGIVEVHICGPSDAAVAVLFFNTRRPSHCPHSSCACRLRHSQGPIRPSFLQLDPGLCSYWNLCASFLRARPPVCKSPSAGARLCTTVITTVRFRRCLPAPSVWELTLRTYSVATTPC